MASGGFQADTNALDQGASEFKSRVDAIAGAHESYHQNAALPDSAFGNLPQSKTLASEYQAFYDQVNNDMTKLATELLGGSGKLALTAILYRAADELAAEYAKMAKYDKSLPEGTG